MSEERKTPGTKPRGVVYDLAARRREAGPARAAKGTESRRPPDETAEARAKRVAELKAQIAAGTYHPDPEEVARKLLQRGFDA